MSYSSSASVDCSSDSDQENCSIGSANRDAEMPEFFRKAFKSFAHFEEEKAQYEKQTLQTFVSSRTIKMGNADESDER